MNALSMPSAAGERIARVAQSAGSQLVETGGFLLARPDGHITVLALTGDHDIHREQHLFAIGSKALDALFDWTVEHHLTVAAQWHSHRYDAFLSETDLAFDLNVPGFRTTVVPNYGHPSAGPVDWGWWVFEDAAWRPTCAPTTSAGPLSVITFDAEGVR